MSLGRSRFAVAVLLAGLVGACATPKQRIILPRTGDAVQDGFTGIRLGPEADRVLWQYRTATELLRRDAGERAAALLDEALEVVFGRFGPDELARRSRSYFARESRKTFIGEPYERAMAFFYRGILYWQQGELDNARACFRSGQIEDGDPEGEAYDGDFVLLDYLDGLASYRLNGQGEDAFKRASRAAKLALPSAYAEVGNVLLFVEYGRAPEKYATGRYGERLQFRDGGSRAVEVIVRSRSTAVHLGPNDDLAYQATTRNGRVMDHVLANKAVFKETSDAVGDAALVSGLILAGDRNTQTAGLGLAAFGLASKLFSAATTPEADTRTWDNLPKFLAFGSLRLPEGTHTLEATFVDDQRQPLPGLTQSITIEVNDATQDTVVFISEFNQ